MDNLCTTYCRPCIYARWNSHGQGNLFCDYIGVTGHRRGCVPGDGCDKRVLGRRKATISYMMYKGKKV